MRAVRLAFYLNLLLISHRAVIAMMGIFVFAAIARTKRSLADRTKRSLADGWAILGSGCARPMGVVIARTKRSLAAMWLLPPPILRSVP